MVRDAGFAGKDRIVTLSVLWRGTFFVAEVALIVLGLAAVDGRPLALLNAGRRRSLPAPVPTGLYAGGRP